MPHSQKTLVPSVKIGVWTLRVIECFMNRDMRPKGQGVKSENDCGARTKGKSVMVKRGKMRLKEGIRGVVAITKRGAFGVRGENEGEG